MAIKRPSHAQQISGGMTIRDIAGRIIAERGLNTGHPKLRRAMNKRVRYVASVLEGEWDGMGGGAGWGGRVEIRE